LCTRLSRTFRLLRVGPPPWMILPDMQSSYSVYAYDERARRSLFIGVRFSHDRRLEGIVSKRLGSRYRSGRSPDWLELKNPEAPAVKREAEEDWGR
jgi:hypothetical protein